MAFKPNPTAKFTVIGGPMRGAIRLSRSREITLGRSPECDFVLVNDPRVSRRHAQILLSAAGYELVGLNDKNPVLVNGRPVSRARLNENDLVTIGSTEIRFNIAYGREDGGGLALVDPNGGAAEAIDYGSPAPAPAAPRSSGGKSPVPTRFIIYAVIAIFGYWLFTSETAKKKHEPTIRTEEQIQNDIKAAEKMREASEAADIRKIDANLALRQAQENYVRGFRDFRKGQYERALTSFQACLALNPEHVLCNRYLRLTQRKFDELVQYEVVLGRRYRDQNQFQACRASFRNVMVMVKDPNSKIFAEAKANYQACDSLVEGHF